MYDENGYDADGYDATGFNAAGFGRPYISALSGRARKALASALTQWNVSPRQFASPEQLAVLNGPHSQEKDKTLATLMPYVEAEVQRRYAEYCAVLRKNADEWWADFEARRAKSCHEPNIVPHPYGDSYRAPDGERMSSTGQKL